MMKSQCKSDTSMNLHPHPDLFGRIVKKHFLLIVLVLVQLSVSLLALPEVGESTDELSQHSYAERTIEGVKALARTGAWPDYFTNEEPKQGSHGPAFIVTVTLLRNLFLPDATSIERLLFSHFLYSLTFLAGVVSLFFLAQRWVSETAAFGTALLFGTQPLLLGHALMNPKDVVFMSLLVTSAALGLRLVDHSEKILTATDRRMPDRIRLLLRPFLSADIWLAGLVLGYASATRIAAPLIGLVVLVYALLARKWHALPRVLAYGVIAFGFMILFWPYLWPAPVERLLESLGYSAYYPGLYTTLFKGMLVDSDQIPRSYLPILLVVQLTETTLLLILVGAISLLRNMSRDLLFLITIWFALPAAAILAMCMCLYDNLRQVFFILPPLFLVAGLGLDWLLTRIRQPAARVLIVLLLLLPGLYANLTLYPYQYIYYNQLVGGVRGAFRHFELDYWHLAFREAQLYINQHAGRNADIFAGNSKTNAQVFARPDLIFNAFGGKHKNCDEYDYIIVSTAQNADEKFRTFPTVFVVERDGVPLVYVKVPKKRFR